jgi:hypothetical protein
MVHLLFAVPYIFSIGARKNFISFGLKIEHWYMHQHQEKEERFD